MKILHSTGVRRSSAVLMAAAALGTLLVATQGSAQNGRREDEAKIRQGFAISPVPLNMAGKNPDLVGMGSYIVNAIASCNDCHSSDPSAEFVAGGVPYFNQHPTKVNPAVYLGGGRDFGPLIPGSADIISRNLTPDKTGMPAGGMSFVNFLQVFQKGTDFDHLHPACGATINTSCLPAPFEGNLLQIMPWPIFQNMTVQDIRAIYEYLSAIPCIAGPPTGELHNNCS